MSPAAEKRSAFLRPPSLAAALSLAREDERFASPVARLRHVEAGQKRQNRLTEACQAYTFDAAKAEAALEDGAWPDGDEYWGGSALALVLEGEGHEIPINLKVAEWLLSRGASPSTSLEDSGYLGGTTALHALARNRNWDLIYDDSEDDDSEDDDGEDDDGEDDDSEDDEN